MKNGLVLLLGCILLIGCKKGDNEIEDPQTHPEMFYKNLEDTEVRFDQIKYLDIDNDGAKDFYFNVQLLGDPVQQRDRIQYLANSLQQGYLLNDAQDQSPILNKFDPVSNTHEGYTWYENSSILLAEKIVTFNGNFWEGLWKDADHKFLPVQVKKNQSLYHGWIELSINTGKEVLILHRSGISKKEDKEVKAGY
ncbi:hypothetical protein C3K47_00700 [Solitalea longa]|uniref:Uncharacterized protein n=1 Tax=Solitalea longa TaxID=2079460 RepID=A0A2S5A9K3_9SPHI|nr:hypothetical protein [Solitalea longa]POY39052.1 hypothetical protein C3K47_00700 [Solitalea longa]